MTVYVLILWLHIDTTPIQLVENVYATQAACEEAAVFIEHHEIAHAKTQCVAMEVVR
jgi:uncharacterized membrane protein